MPKKEEINDKVEPTIEQRVFKVDDDFTLPPEGLVALASNIENNTVLYRLFRQWRLQRREKILKDMFLLSTNPEVGERIMGICLGKIKAMEDDMEALFKYAVVFAKNLDKKKKKQEESEA